jgi:cation transport ATPase
MVADCYPPAKEVSTVQWDLGIQGIALLIVMSLAFGVFTQVVFWHRTTPWLGLIASVAAFVVGAFVSEVWFGWATAAELQPNIDGLSFDETLIGFLVGGAVVLVARYLAARNPRRQPLTS